MTLLTPGAAVTVGACFAAALLVLVVAARRVEAVRRALRLPPGARRWLAAEALLVVLAGVFLSVAAAQPAVWQNRTAWATPSVEVIFAFDISRSMLAAPSPLADDRLERARKLAVRLRSDVTDIPIGVATFTDRALPLSPPGTNRSLFADTVDGLVRIEEPPPMRVGAAQTTDLRSSVQQLTTFGFFGERAKRRTLVIFSDAESRTNLDAAYGKAVGATGIPIVLVRLWDSRERVWDARGRPESYRPDAGNLDGLRGFVEATGGRLYGERDERALAASLARLSAGAPRVAVGRSKTPSPLGQYLVLVSVLPLGALGLLRTRF